MEGVAPQPETVPVPEQPMTEPMPENPLPPVSDPPFERESEEEEGEGEKYDGGDIPR